MKIRSRRSWSARSPRPRLKQNPLAVRELFVHWPGGEPASWAHIRTVAQEQETMRSIQAFHMGPDRGWSDFAYSYAIFASGRVYRGRGLTYVPAAQLGHNTGTVAVICFLGPDDVIPRAVEDSVKALRRHVRVLTGGRPISLRPHRSVTSTECPGDRLAKMVERLA